MVTRTITGVILAAVLVGALALGGWWFSVLYMAAIALSVYEMVKAIKAGGHKPCLWPMALCTALSLPLLTLGLGKSAVIMPLMTAACMLTAAVIMFRKEPKLEDILMSVLPLLAVVLPGMCMLALSRAPSREVELMLILLSFGVPLMGDTMAYFGGSLLGKRKLCPAVSPKKSVEGAAAGLFGSVLFAIVTWLIFARMTVLPPVWHALVLGLLGGVAGQLGDLFASLLKRHAGVKDYGSIFPGHGGMMDRLDSVYWATVVMYVYLIWFM